MKGKRRPDDDAFRDAFGGSLRFAAPGLGRDGCELESCRGRHGVFGRMGSTALQSVRQEAGCERNQAVGGRAADPGLGQGKAGGGSGA